MSLDNDAQNLLDSLAERGIEPANNAWVAGRMPPGQCFGLHPASSDDQPGYHDTYDNGALTAELQAQLGPAMPNPTLAFGRAASSDAPGYDNPHEFNPGLLT